MPRLPIDYSKTIMYKLVCNDLKIKECYVGHTTEMTKRKNNHKSSCNNEKDNSYNQKKYIYMRDNGGWDNWSMVMIEEYSCKNKQEAVKRERELYEDLEAKLNTIRPYVNEVEIKEQISNNAKKWNDTHKEYKKEYYENNKEQRKEHYEKHKEEIKEQHKKYRENNKEKIKEQQKEKYENNKEELNKKAKEYYEINKEKTLEKYKQKECCEYCNKEMRKDSIKKHHKICPNRLVID